MKSAVVSSLDTKVKIANMYYKENMSQQEIAEALDMSRTTVSRILKNCLDEGIVSIHIKNTSTYQYELELQVKKKYGLKHVCVVSNQDKKNKVIQEIGNATADYLKEIIDRPVRIGVSMGSTVAGVISQLKPIENNNVEVFQLSGDVNHQMSNCSSFLTIETARILRGVPHAMHVPLLVHTKVLRDLLLEEPLNKQHFQEIRKLDIALVGIGTMDAILPETSDTWYTYENDKANLLEQNAVGDICGVWLDEDGALCETDIQDRTIAVSLDVLKQVPYVITVACGRNKKRIAKAVLKGRYTNVLMIDEALACALLEDD
ncbi:winged helix-turn-helix transcriptional regulator [Faecalicatena sp. AGMB00832]|uniref:Winged helix-turn-helix transcriptional regulator n=1 Tax=Faecalicatena faecalis TaxID=2726362 RepID=A0ABS6CZM6_9FIRM|nr:MULTISPECIES: sugar-binding domain-containing protein [Faecalicatena]MBU3874718.1 winged helix-turn-helix transcriptional regulator [Faecalicatena faecalis]MCI6464887.1 winged helix-turn-helix transcriptional regulator [Faecalicatena sp.]MDY5619911.1 sugar-binding domain-containing protein [Lachnospiraceae bacterium]